MIAPGDGDPRHGTANGYKRHGCRCDACRAANTAGVRRRREARRPSVPPAPRAKKARKRGFYARPDHPGNDSGAKRAEFDCICTFENDRGQGLVLHRTGAPTKIVPAILDEVVALDPSFRLVCYSTPATIYTDLQGHRYADQRPAYGDDRVTRTHTPESQILGRVKRLDMLHPRLRAGTRHG